MTVTIKTRSLLPVLLKILPFVSKELADWEDKISRAESEFLKQQGLASIKNKKFHCQGGSFFSGFRGEFDQDIAKFIVAYQTISDFLDNLCDRSGFYSDESFARLHLAMHDVFYSLEETDISSTKYYSLSPWDGDAGYLQQLVTTCRRQLIVMPYIHKTIYDMAFFTKLYTELQVFKHIHSSLRTHKLTSWYNIYSYKSPVSNEIKDLKWWEFSCAAGSTLTVFVLLLIAKGKIPVTEKDNLLKCYFPWVCSLHILLDYLIDQEEDRNEGDLNFVSFYSNRGEVLNRIGYITSKAYKRADQLTDASFHHTIINGLLAIYLSDPKIERQNMQELKDELLVLGGKHAYSLYSLCKLFRKMGVI